MSHPNHKAEARLTPARVRELFDYDPLTGRLARRGAAGNRAKGARGAGSLQPGGYRRVSLDGRSYYAHRVVWLHVRGRWPTGHIDHVNGARDDNRIANLRDMPPGWNQKNRRRDYRWRDGVLPGTFRTPYGRWRASVSIKRRSRYLGTFDTAEEAHAAHLAAKRRLKRGNTL